MKIQVRYTVELREDQLAALNSLRNGEEEMTQKDIKRYLRDLGVGGVEELTTRFCWRTYPDEYPPDDE